MELSFLGKRYNKSLSNIEPTETVGTGTFLGRSYTMTRGNASNRHSPNQSLQFLGRKYHQ